MGAVADHVNVLEEADKLTCGPRMKFYGPPQENLQDIADLWTPYVRRALEVKGALDSSDVSMLMIFLKGMRQVRGYHRDSTADIAGYARLVEVVNEPDAFRAFVLRAAEMIPDLGDRDDFLEAFGVDDKEPFTK